MVRNLYYIHGMDSSPQGFRAQYLARHYPGIVIPALPNDVDRRREILLETLRAPAYVVGNSLGGLSSLDFVRHYPKPVKAMVLLAPAVGFHEPRYQTAEIQDFVAQLYIPSGMPTTVVAALRDEVVRLEAIDALVQRSPDPANIRFIRVDDDHLMHLESSLRVMREAIDHMLRAPVPDPV